MYFLELQDRLTALLRTRTRNGETSERRLARLTGVSQPHIHNVLKGARILSPRAADQVLRRLGMTILDLLPPGLPSPGPCPHCGSLSRYVEVPVLDGWLGPGLPLPRGTTDLESHPFPRAFVASLERAVVVRLAPDPQMGALIQENDLILLDRAHARRLYVDPQALYVVNHQGVGLIRRLQLAGERGLRLCGAPSSPERQVEVLSLEGKHLLDVIKARVAWIGRYL